MPRQPLSQHPRSAANAEQRSLEPPDAVRSGRVLKWFWSFTLIAMAAGLWSVHAHQDPGTLFIGALALVGLVSWHGFGYVRRELPRTGLAAPGRWHRVVEGAVHFALCGMPLGVGTGVILALASADHAVFRALAFPFSFGAAMAPLVVGLWRKRSSSAPGHPHERLWTRLQELERLANTDPLTGLPNRLAFERQLEQLAGHEHGPDWACLLIDLDGFKRINDEHGHAAGDALLRAVGERLQQAMRAGDFVARLGGDEFVALIRDDDALMAAHAARERILSTLAPPVSYEGMNLQARASIGCAVATGAQSPQVVLAAADAEMYRDKSKRQAAARGVPT